MNKIILCLFFCGLLTGPEVGHAKKIIFISLFENLTRVKDNITYEARLTSSNKDVVQKSYSVDRYSEIPRTILEDIVVDSGAEVVERQSLDKLLLENKFISLSGLVDSKTAIDIGKFLGANTLILGSITELNKRSSSFRNYDIKVTTKFVSCNIRIRVIDIETGKIIFSERVENSLSTIDTSPTYYEAVEATLEKLAKNKDFINSLR